MSLAAAGGGGDGRVIYRIFRNHPNDIKKLPDGRYCLSSGLFSASQMSVFDGDLISHNDCPPLFLPETVGVAVILRSVFDKEQLVIEPKPHETHASHCEIVGRIGNGAARRLKKASRIVVPIEGIDVVNGDPPTKDGK